MKSNRIISILVILLLLSACSTVRPLPIQTDSTKVEVRVETVTVTDTAFVELPVIVEKVVTLDTASVLENKYAKSEAIVSGGVLVHSLATKPVKQPVLVDKQIVYRDSLVFRDRVKTERVEVEKKLNLWQRVCLALGSIIMWLLIAWIVYTIIRFIVSLNLKKS